jgi:hypothetical protein
MLATYYSGDHIEKNKMGGACNTMEESYVQGCVGET